MNLYFKDDWDEAKQMLTGWWNHEVNGRWALGVVAKRNQPLPHNALPTLSEDFKTRWLDFKTMSAHKEAWFSKNCFLGCVFPESTAYLGPGSLNPFLGSSIDFQENTLWYNPVADNPEKVDHLNFDKTGFYWNWTKEALAYIAEQAKNRYIVTMPDLIEGLDILSELLGTQEFLMHLLDCPEAIHRLLDQLDDIYFEAYDELAKIIRQEDGTVPFTAFNTWGPGRCAKVQCDFSIMISPDMFEEFVKPRIQKQCRRLDYTVYHLDGPDAIRHIDAVLSIPELNALQWTPGESHPHPGDKSWWEPVWEKVYSAGKSALVLGVPPDSVEPFVKEFGQNGTMIITETKTENQAQQLMDNSLNW